MVVQTFSDTSLDTHEGQTRTWLIHSLPFFRTAIHCSQVEPIVQLIFWKEVILFYFFTLFYFTILHWFCHTSTWIHHGYTRVPHPESPSHLPARTVPLGRLSAPTPSIQYHALNLDWQFVSYTIFNVFQCHSPNSSHPLPLPQSPKDCSVHLCLFCCLAYRVIITIFLNSIYMH